jgi:hypothetical protein
MNLHDVRDYVITWKFQSHGREVCTKPVKISNSLMVLLDRSVIVTSQTIHSKEANALISLIFEIQVIERTSERYYSTCTTEGEYNGCSRGRETGRTSR